MKVYSNKFGCHDFNHKEIINPNKEGSLYWLLSDLTTLPDQNEIEDGKHIPAVLWGMHSFQNNFIQKILDNKELESSVKKYVDIKEINIFKKGPWGP